MAIGLGLGIGISIGGVGRSGEPVPRLHLSGLSIAETGGSVGTLSTANKPDDWGDCVYSIPEGGDPDGKFSIDGNEVSASDLDFENAQSHPLTVLDTPTGPYDPISRTFTIQVTNVIEAPVNLVAPVVTGVEQVGEILSCSTGTWTDMEAGTYAYQWINADGDVPIDGATSSAFLIPPELEGEEVYCEVTATNAADSTSEDSNTVGPFDPAAGTTPVPIQWGGVDIEWGGEAISWGTV